MECHSFIEHSWVYLLASFLNFRVHACSKPLLKVIEQFREMNFGFIKHILNIFLLVLLFAKLRSSTTIELSLQLMVYIEVSSDRTFKVVMLGTTVSTSDNSDHLSAVGVELIVVGRPLLAVPISE